MIDRANRVGLFAFGLFLAALGVGALVTRAGYDEPGAVYFRVRSAVADRSFLWFAVLFVGSLLAIFVGSRLVVAQLGLRKPPPPSPYLVTGTRGRTRVEPRVVEHALEAHMRGRSGIQESRARVITLGRETSVALSLKVEEGIDLDQVRSEAQAACQHLCHALGARSVGADLEIDLDSKSGPRVR